MRCSTAAAPDASTFTVTFSLFVAAHSELVISVSISGVPPARLLRPLVLFVDIFLEEVLLASFATLSCRWLVIVKRWRRALAGLVVMERVGVVTL